MDKPKLKKLYLNGYKSFRYDAPLVGSKTVMGDEDLSGKTIDFGDVTVLLGANGAGKSNVVSFFRMLNFMMSGTLQLYVQDQGTSDAMLYFGRQATRTLEAELEFAADQKQSLYRFALADAQPDTLIYTHEEAIYKVEGFPRPRTVPVGGGQRESCLKEKAEGGEKTCEVIYGLLSRCRNYQFHDTSATAKVRKGGYIEDAGYLRDDAGNLAAYLRAMRKAYPRYYERIVETVRQVFPQFGDFVLDPSVQNENYILLNWRQRTRSGYLLGPHQISDGTLRFMALAALFMQPPDKLPSVIVIDEPELGLHPYAITVLASMIRSASTKCQVILSTQSTRLVDEFGLEEIVIVEYDDKESCTRCKRPDPEALKEWIQRYSVSELWEKNVLGGRP